MSVQVPGALATTLAGLLALEQTINGELPVGARTLTVDKWRRLQLPSLPAIWNWEPSTSPVRRTATNRVDDEFFISAYVGVEHQDDQSQMDAVELYADVACQVFDLDFAASPLLGGSVQFAERLSQRLVVDTFGGTDVLCVEIPLRLLVHRIV